MEYKRRRTTTDEKRELMQNAKMVGTSYIRTFQYVAINVDIIYNIFFVVFMQLTGLSGYKQITNEHYVTQYSQ